MALVDEFSRRRRVGLVSGATADVSQPLLSPTYYVQRALAPFADVREPRMGPVEAIRSLLDEKTPMLVLADIGTLPPDLRDRLAQYVQGGGVLLRFAGNRLAAATSTTCPRCACAGAAARSGAHCPGTARARSRPSMRRARSTAYAAEGRRHHRQLLAEPDADLSRKTWAALADGTPIITAERRGQGLIVLVHVTADTTWSNLPLSGLFVEMLRKIVALAGTGDAQAKAAGGGATVFASPLRTLDGFGTFNPPPATARPVAVGGDLVGSRDHPPGFYGSPDAPDRRQHAGPRRQARRRSISRRWASRPEPIVREAAARPAALAGGAGAVRLRARHHRRALARRPAELHPQEPPGGGLDRPRRRRAGAGAGGRAPDALAQTAPSPAAPPPAVERPPISPKEADGALATRFAYVLSGDAAVDEISRAGLAGLGSFMSARTALDPAEPAGVDPGARRALALSADLLAHRAEPAGAGEAAIRRLDEFMKNGGTVVFDTRDALSARPGAPPTPETRILRQILAGIAVPDLEPVPRDHVITKAFYLIDNFPGRYNDGQTWIEALPREGPMPTARPARATACRPSSSPRTTSPPPGRPAGAASRSIR